MGEIKFGYTDANFCWEQNSNLLHDWSAVIVHYLYTAFSRSRYNDLVTTSLWNTHWEIWGWYSLSFESRIKGKHNTNIETSLIICRSCPLPNQEKFIISQILINTPALLYQIILYYLWFSALPVAEGEDTQWGRQEATAETERVSKDSQQTEMFSRTTSYW